MHEFGFIFLNVLQKWRTFFIMKKIFIDGSAGTTGLKVAERLSERKDIELIKLSEENRKNVSARADAINSSDISFLCLPDDAAREAVSLVKNPETVIIDTSTAHRTNDEWTYGFPEIHNLKEKIKTSKRIANPGCYASGFISLAAPLVEAGVISDDAHLTCFGISGYSGGGKKMIAQYEADEKGALLEGPRMYGLTQAHKHLPEMCKISGLKNKPVFTPIVAPFYSGMEICISLFAKDIKEGFLSGTKGALDIISEIYADYYKKGLVHFEKNTDEDGFLSASAFSGRDDMQICVNGNEERLVLVSRFDNLGKGASGAAIQNMNISIGTDETLGLNV